MPNSKQIVYLSQSQYAELIANGSITVDGVTVQYDENDIYVTPQAEPVTDVRMNGTSVATNGVANIPLANNQLGLVKVGSSQSFGVKMDSAGNLDVRAASDDQIKGGISNFIAVTPSQQHKATFYGLAKAAEDTTQSESSNVVGSYTPEAKGAIQSMLGVSDLIATAEPTLVASKAYAIGDVFTANGKLYKATAAIAANDTIVLQNEGETISGANAIECKISGEFVKFTDYASSNTAGVVKVAGYGVEMGTSGLSQYLVTRPASSSEIKAASTNNYCTYRPIVPRYQHESTFYGLAKAAGADEKDSTLPVGQYTDTAKTAIRTMLGAVGDVQVNGTSVVSSGVANIPLATANDAGVVKVGSNGVGINNGILYIQVATAAEIKTGTTTTKAIVPANQQTATFYGLAKASGDTTMSSSSNAVGTYTDSAKASIKQMLGIVDGSTGTVDVTGAAPTITAVENTRYVCGEVTSLTFTPPASGISIVRFTSGSTPTVLTLPSTVKFPEWFDSTTLETDTIYEICITDGIYGAVMSWAL